MMRIPAPRRGFVRGFGLATAAMLVLATATGEPAEALSPINPGAAPAAKQVSDAATTEVRFGHGGGRGGGGFHGGGGFRGGGGGFRGGGAAFHGGGFRGGGAAFHRGGFRGGGFRHGGAAFHGGGFRAAHIYRGGGYRYGGFHYGGRRFVHRHYFHRRFYYAPSYYNYAHRYCRIVWTHYGPRKICRYRPWHHHWRHRHYRSIYW